MSKVAVIGAGHVGAAVGNALVPLVAARIVRAEKRILVGAGGAERQLTLTLSSEDRERLECSAAILEAAYRAVGP